MHRAAAPRILIGICSCHATRERRDAVRETWLAALPETTRAVFFVGAGLLAGEPEVVCLPVPDDYQSLSVKVHAFYRYALAAFQFDFLFKCDDDTYVHAERLATIAREAFDFVGSRQFDSHGFASGGAGYLMSRRIVEHFVSEPVVPRCDEDVVFSSRVPRDRARCKTTDALQGLGADMPEFANDVATGHWCPPERMRRIHARLTGADHGGILLDLRAVHRVWSGVIRLLRDGTFWSRGAGMPDGVWRSGEGGAVLLLQWCHWPADTLHLTDREFAGSELRLEFDGDDDRCRWLEHAAAHGGIAAV